ncbi:MAG: DUF354 domain-containing protein [Thermoproteaceae archaeon]|nr:DUF354 domain-containing protein [Thermoproteaceae archaeon]
MTRLLFDALTPKQARVAATLYGEAASRGIALVITCREYMHLADIFEMYGVPHVCIGKYGIATREKLLHGLERQARLLELAESVDGMLSFPSPDAARVIFGLGKPVIVLNDTPHAVHVNKLVLPLADVLIAPSAVPEEAWRQYCPGRVVTFEGVFEYMWTSRFKPDEGVIKRLGLGPGEYVVFRPEESHAAYYKWEFSRVRRGLVEEFKRRGLVVVNVPRYPDQLLDGAINITKAVDHLQLAYFSACVVTGGSTMATEAALLGVPALSYFPASYYIDTYLQKLGAPLFRCLDAESCVRAVDGVLRAGRSTPMKFENPARLIIEVAAGAVK